MHFLSSEAIEQSVIGNTSSGHLSIVLLMISKLP